ncbi:P-II family nitrogen regulator, partial [Vibrio parahaemolyticus]|nr:P-II family nitrogen regulator [Vibrio parahaemolyticus]
DKCVVTIIETAQTGKIGDGKIFVTDIERVVRIRTGEEDGDAI